MSYPLPQAPKFGPTWPVGSLWGPEKSHGSTVSTYPLPKAPPPGHYFGPQTEEIYAAREANYEKYTRRGVYIWGSFIIPYLLFYFFITMFAIAGHPGALLAYYGWYKAHYVIIWTIMTPLGFMALGMSLPHTNESSPSFGNPGG